MKKFSILLAIFALIAGLCLLGCEGPAGAPGIAGEDGTPGADGVKGPKGPDGQQGPVGPNGDDGPAGEVVNGQDGERGDQGPSVRLLGEQANKEALASLAGAKGSIDAWLVSGELWIWSEADDEEALDSIAASATLEGDTEPTTGFWIKKGAIRGPQGPRGDDGDEGLEGASTDGISFATVTYDTSAIDNKITVGSEIVIAGGKLKEPKQPVKRLVDFPSDGLYKNVETINWIFDGWYDGVEKWDFDKKIEGPMTLVAKFTPPPPCDLRFFADGVTANTGVGTVAKAVNYIITANGVAVSNDPYVLYIGHDLTEWQNQTPITIGSATIQGIPQQSQRMNLTLKGLHSQRKITRQGTGSLFAMGSSTGTAAPANSFILTLDNVVLAGGLGTTTPLEPLVNLTRGSALVMEEGSGITGNRGGGVRLPYAGSNTSPNNATFTMNGGEISDNIAIGGALYTLSTAANFNNIPFGAIKINAGNTFTMNGGKIINNGAYFSNAATNTGTASAAIMTGVHAIANQGIFILNDGEISGNGKFTGVLADQKISEFVATSATNGGSVAVIAGNIAEMNGGKIIDNSSLRNCVVAGTIDIMTAGEITGNDNASAALQEGSAGKGIAVLDVKTMTGGTIRGNTGYNLGDVNVLSVANGDAKIGTLLLWYTYTYSSASGRTTYATERLRTDITNWTGTIDNINLLPCAMKAYSNSLVYGQSWLSFRLSGTMTTPQINNQVGPIKNGITYFPDVTGSLSATTWNLLKITQSGTVYSNYLLSDTYRIESLGTNIGNVVAK